MNLIYEGKLHVILMNVDNVNGFSWESQWRHSYVVARKPQICQKDK